MKLHTLRSAIEHLLQEMTPQRPTTLLEAHNQQIIQRSQSLFQYLSKKLRENRFKNDALRYVYERYVRIFSQLQHDYPHIFLELQPSFQSIQQTETILTFLIKDICSCCDMLTQLPDEQIYLEDITHEGIFFAGQQFQAFVHVAKILRSANSHLVIIDNYIKEDILDILEERADRVTIHVLTVEKNLKPAFKSFAKRFCKQYPLTEFRHSVKFHDRFVVLDKTLYIHFGASLADVGKRGFMFSRIEEPLVINTLQQEIEKEWQRSPTIKS